MFGAFIKGLIAPIAILLGLGMAITGSTGTAILGVAFIIMGVFMYRDIFSPPKSYRR